MADTQAPPQPQPLAPVTGESMKLDGERALEAKGEPPKDDTGNWPFIEPQPIREDQVQNAVKFLSHPKVQGSPIVHRRSFLERKGLSKEEIDEAFRRVPDPPSNKFSGAAAATEGQSIPPGQQNLTTPISTQQQPMTQHLVPAASLPIVQASSRPHWSQMVLAVGVLVAAGAGTGILFQRVLIRKMKSWIRWVVLEDEDAEVGKLSKRNTVEEAASAAAVAANAAAAAATAAVGASREMIKMRSEEWQHLSSVVKALEVQTRELKNALMGMKVAMQTVDKPNQLLPVTNMQSGDKPDADYRKAQPNGSWRTLSPIEHAQPTEGTTITPKPSNFGATSNGVHNNGDTVRPLSAPPSSGPDRAPHSASYMEVLAMLERGEKPPGIQEVNDKPPNPDQPPSSSRLQPRPKPWETVRTQSSNNLPISRSFSSKSIAPVPDNTIRSAPASENWIQGDASLVLQGKITSSVDSGSGMGMPNAESWWRQKKALPELPSLPSWPPESTVKITEMDLVPDGDAVVAGSSSQPGGSGSHGEGDLKSKSANDMVGRQSWVPPPIPLTVMPGAAAAIKYQKTEAKVEVKPLLLEQEITTPVSFQTGQDFPQVAPTTEVEDTTLSVQQSVQDGEGQERGSPEQTHSPFQDGEPEVEQEL